VEAQIAQKVVAIGTLEVGLVAAEPLDFPSRQDSLRRLPKWIARRTRTALSQHSLE